MNSKAILSTLALKVHLSSRICLLKASQTNSFCFLFDSAEGGSAIEAMHCGEGRNVSISTQTQVNNFVFYFWYYMTHSEMNDLFNLGSWYIQKSQS